MGETITLSLELRRLGRRSVTIDVTGHAGGATRFSTQQVLVTTSLDTGASIDIPDDIRAALARFAPDVADTKQEPQS
jgi:4-hydroxybenzoyl-CoA thioesterase